MTAGEVLIMADKTELKARLEFRKKALEKLRAAYLALLDGGENPIEQARADAKAFNARKKEVR